MRVKNKEESQGFAGIGLYNPKSMENYGSVVRAAGCYEAAMVVMQGRRFRGEISKACTDTEKVWKRIPVIETADLLSVVPFGTVPVAVELVEGAKSLVDYVHPERAFYIFGPEDGSVPKNIMAKCRDVVYIPTSSCLNLSMTVNTVLFDRMSKQLRK